MPSIVDEMTERMLELARRNTDRASAGNITFTEGGCDVALPGHGTLDAYCRRIFSIALPLASSSISLSR